MSFNRFKAVVTGGCILFIALHARAQSTQVKATVRSRMADLVVLTSLDGVRPDALQVSTSRCILGIAREGTTATEARTIDNSTTLPSHASMVSGVDVQQHGLDFNSFRPERGIIKSTTVFKMARAAGIPTAMLVSKPKFMHLVEPDGPEIFKIAGPNCTRVNAQALPLIRSGFRGFMMLHYSEADVAGHRHRWMSSPYFAAIRTLDACVCEIKAALQERDKAERVFWIVTADHGGHERMHGTQLEVDKRIPWFAWGSAARLRTTFNTPISTMDTAATILRALGLPVPMHMVGKPVDAAFDEGLLASCSLPPR